MKNNHVNKINESLQPVVDEIIAALENDLVTPGSPYKWLQTLKMGGVQYNHESQNRYRGINILLLWKAKALCDFESNQWLTFNQANKLGLKIKKGSVSTTIFHCGEYFRKEVDEETGEEKKIPSKYLKTYRVFNLSQTEDYNSLNDPSILTTPYMDELGVASEFGKNCTLRIIDGTKWSKLIRTNLHVIAPQVITS